MSEKKEKMVTIELIVGHGSGEGLYLDDTRIAGSNPMPGGKIVKSWTASVSEIRAILRNVK